MKIGVYDPYLDSLSGGEKYMLTIASHFAKEHSVDIFWNEQGADEIKNKAEGKFNIDLKNVSFVENIFSHKNRSIDRVFTSRKYDVIFYLSDGSIPFIFSKKLIVHFQFPVEWVKNTFKTKIKLRNATIICNSIFTKQYIDRKFLVKSMVVYPPVDIEKEDKNVKKENIILTVGRFEELSNGATFKKQELLIDQFKKLPKNIVENWSFYIVTSTSGQNEKSLEELEKRARGFSVKILKNISKKEIDGLYNKAKIYWHGAGYKEDLVLHPERAEHFGISTVEAMTRGAIPIVFKGGGLEEIVENGKSGYLWETEEELISRTIQVTKGGEVIEKMILNAEIRAKNFSKEIFYSKIDQLIT